MSETAWRSGLPLWRTDDGAQRAFYGSALLLDAGAEYDVRVTVSDPDGVDGPTTLTGTIATRAENVAPASELVPTHYVRADGDDGNPGTSPSAAWATLEKAIKSAPAGAVVQVGPGFYVAPNTARTLPITLIAQEPAVDANRDPINEGRRSVVEPPGVSSPTGATDGPNPGVWQRVSLTGPTTGEAYTVWVWRESPAAKATQVGYAATRAGLPERVAVWAADNADLATPAGWAEKLYTNQTYNYGAYLSGADVYLRLPPTAPSANPNELYITVGGGMGLALNGPNIRVSGFEVRQADSGIELQVRATGGVVDHNLISGTRIGMYFRASSGPPAIYGSDHVFEHNRIVDANLWTADHAGRPAIPWNFIKGAIKNADGTSYRTAKLGARSESIAISGRGGALRTVIRHNTIDGPFNGIGTGYNVGFDRYAGMDMDVYGNLLRHLADDALEPEGQVINFRAWGNRVEQASTFLSTGPVSYGPLYIFRNEGWRLGNAGAGRDNAGVPALAGRVFKYSGTSRPVARVYVLHNTLWTDQVSPNGIDGGAQSASAGASPEAFYLRNNIIRTTASAFEAPTVVGRWDEDYNHFSTSDATRGLRFGQRYTTDVGAYRAASGQGAHTNAVGDFITPVVLAAPAVGDLGLPAGSPLIDAGVPVPNLSNRPGLDYAGSAPDLGALER